MELTNAINFASSNDAAEGRVMYSSIANTKFAPYSDANDVIDKHFKSLHSS